jgi:cell division protein FtsI (penicillin-binding protein 3)
VASKENKNRRIRPKKEKPAYISWRFNLVLIVVALAFLSLFLRTAWIQVINPDKLIYEGDLRSVRKLASDATRGTIYDRNGEPLAISIPVRAIYVDPKVIHEKGSINNKEAWKAIAEVLDEPYEELMEKIANPHKRFVYLQRQVTSAIADFIEQLHLEGVYTRNEYRRFYPTGEINAQLIGITNIDDHGIEGVEKSYDDWLTATPSKKRVRKDARGNVIETLGYETEGKPAGDITLSIDHRLQSIAYSAVKSAYEQRNATSISLVLADVQTGEILAMVNAPSFNPNAHNSYESQRARNRAITDTYEPGSTVKPIVAISALEHKVTNWNEVFDTRPFRIYTKTITDSHRMASGNIADIIKYSSNIGMARIALRMNPDDIVQTLSDFGLGVKQDLGLVGEASGMLPHRRRWSDIEKATIGFGYGLRISPIQLTSAYVTIANGGIHKPLSILKLDPGQLPAGVRVADEKIMKRMAESLETVVGGGGTGSQARIPGYTVAGKTGTAKVAVRGGYGKDYVGTFAGYAPASNPRFALVAIVNEPKKGGFYGGVVAGPLFAEVMSAALQLYNVPPDDLKTNAK